MTKFSSARRVAGPVLRREMRERWRRPLTFLQLALWALALALAGYKFYGNLVPPDGFAEKNNLAGTGRALFYSVGRAQLLAWIPVGMLLAAPALAVERERGHLPEWLLAGLRPEAIARAKFRALAARTTGETQMGFNFSPRRRTLLCVAATSVARDVM